MNKTKETIVEELLEKGMTVATRTNEMQRPTSKGHEAKKLLLEALTQLEKTVREEEEDKYVPYLESIKGNAEPKSCISCEEIVNICNKALNN